MRTHTAVKSLAVHLHGFSKNAHAVSALGSLPRPGPFLGPFLDEVSLDRGEEPRFFDCR